MKITILTLFPEMFVGPFSESIIKRAQKKGLVDIDLVNFRDFATDKHKTVDDTPCGGGPGMLIKVDVIDKALEYITRSFFPSVIPDLSSVILNGVKNLGDSRTNASLDPSAEKRPQDDVKSKIVLLSPSGQKFDQKKAYEYSKLDHLILIAGHYEGFDQRIHDHLIDEEISIGDYVLSGGELPAMVVVDTVTRLIPGTIRPESLESETCNSKCHPPIESGASEPSFGHPEQSEGSSEANNGRNGLDSSVSPQNDLIIDFPQYTRPAEYKGWKVPNVLVSGNHAEIKKWRSNQQAFL